ncbi:MAG: hypothetical protein J2P17_32665, partial [Mycobacterium sp.]|nr:hypothetical protein [Mycobacterium sp.]
TFQRHERHMRGIPLSEAFRPFEPHEKEAHTLRTFEHSVAPGLFQTEDYAQSILATFPDITADVVKERVAGRMERQAILRRDDPPPPHIWAVLDEHVLNRSIGGSAVMAAQMERMAELARTPRINIQVIPAEVEHPGLMGAFVIAETRQSPAIVFMENASDGQTVEDAEMAAKMTVLFDSLRMEALTGSASLKLIEEAAQRWKEQIAP